MISKVRALPQHAKGDRHAEPEKVIGTFKNPAVLHHSVINGNMSARTE